MDIFISRPLCDGGTEQEEEGWRECSNAVMIMDGIQFSSCLYSLSPLFSSLKWYWVLRTWLADGG